MRVDEFFNPIIAVMHRTMLTEEPIKTATVSRNWHKSDLGGKPDDDFKLLGKLGRFKIGVQPEWSNVTNVFVIDDNNEIVGKLELVDTNSFNKNIKFWRVFKSVLRRDLQGKGIMPRVYAFIINHGYNLQADAEQSIGSQKVWAKLSKNPNITVYAALHDNSTGETEFSDVEGLQQLQANFTIYDSETEEELKYIENEIDSLRDIRNRINDDYLNIPQGDNEAEKKLSDEYYRLTDQIRKLELELNNLQQQHREEARKDLYLLAIPADKSMPVNEDDDDEYEEQHRENQSDLEMVQIDGMNIMYLHNPREEIQLAAVKQNPFAIYEIDNPKSKLVILTAILGILKSDSYHNASRLTREYRKKYPDWPEWETITRSLKAIQ